MSGNSIRRRNHSTEEDQQLSGKNDYSTMSSSSKKTYKDQETISSLNRTRNMLQTELERVAHISSALDSDGHMLASTKDEYQAMQEETKGAKGSLYRLKRLEMEDSIIFWASVIFFYSVCLYVLWSRIRIPFLLW